jgi:serine/threonine-protein kinase RsbW
MIMISTIAISRPIPERTADGWKRATLSLAFEIVPLLDEITSIMALHGFDERDTFAARLALEEAMVNGMRHGNRSDPNKRVLVRYSVDVDRLLAEIEDEGPGFKMTAVPDPTDPHNLEKPSGRGLLLIQHYATWVRYNEKGNRVTICKVPSAR